MMEEKQQTAEDNLKKVHKELETALRNATTLDQLAYLKDFFKRNPIPLSEIERIRNFSQLWEALEERKTISIGNYEALKVAFEAITGSTSNLQSILKKHEIWITSLAQTVEDKKV